MRLLTALLLVIFCLPGLRAEAQNENRGSLYKIISRLDSALFQAFNSRDINSLRNYFSADLELYQDNVGVRNYTQTIEAFAELFKKDYVLKRELIPGTLEVYPIKDFGAVQTGLHKFCHTENNKYECGTFKFMHIWKKESSGWKIIRLITYDH